MDTSSPSMLAYFHWPLVVSSSPPNTRTESRRLSQVSNARLTADEAPTSNGTASSVPSQVNSGLKTAPSGPPGLSPVGQLSAGADPTESYLGKLIRQAVDEGVKRVMKKTLEGALAQAVRESANAANKPNRPDPPTLRFIIHSTYDIEKLQRMGSGMIAARFGEQSAPFNKVMGTFVSGNCLKLFCESEIALEEIKERVGFVGHVLGISHLRLVPTVFYVEAIGFDFTDAELKNAKDSLAKWGVDNGVKFASVTKSFRRVVLGMWHKEHARALCSKFVFLNGRKGFVEPIDTRSLPYFCFNCSAPGHFRHQCQSSLTCGKCAGDHASFNCAVASDFTCPNCKKGLGFNATREDLDHQAWSPKCKFPETTAMFKECRKHTGSPLWATNLQQTDADPPVPKEGGATAKRRAKKDLINASDSKRQTTNLSAESRPTPATAPVTAPVTAPTKAPTKAKAQVKLTVLEQEPTPELDPELDPDTIMEVSPGRPPSGLIPRSTPTAEGAPTAIPSQKLQLSWTDQADRTLKRRRITRHKGSVVSNSQIVEYDGIMSLRSPSSSASRGISSSPQMNPVVPSSLSNVIALSPTDPAFPGSEDEDDC
ncbi:Putative Zinc finger, CCHC-type [Colletotrichum destructivum]|uniref:Zinc finger, CCHC-type n=1 Tax=Colletotrichum destructivum TaxID=34406 RepID=A0AAX4IWI3_9PEZI|nr:Putative Zinc finger, CCHC-type [Colletotrichum destructivum]